MNFNSIGQDGLNNFEGLLQQVQNEDRRSKRLIKGVFILYLVCSVLYTLLFIVNPDPDLGFTDRLSGGLYVLAFVLGTAYFRYEYNHLKKLDYSQPLLTLLQKTEKRYRFFNVKWFPVLGVVSLIGAGITLSFIGHRFINMDVSLAVRVLLIQGGYWFIMLCSGFIGYLIWRKRHRPIHRQIRTMLSELEHETGED